MLKAKTQKIIQDLALKYNLKVVIVFGSAARKKRIDRKSDIDLAILADRDFYEKELSNFNYGLMEAEEIEHREIDVVPVSNQNPLLLFNIFNEGIPVYIRDKQEYYRLRSWARFSYEESRRFFSGREKLLAQRLKKLGD